MTTLIALFIASALAQNPVHKPMKSPCAADRKKFCATTTSDTATDCLKANVKKLSAECRNLVTLKPRLQSAQLACEKDAQTYCAAVKNSRTALVECMRKNIDKLSPACQALGGVVHEN